MRTAVTTSACAAALAAAALLGAAGPAAAAPPDLAPRPAPVPWSTAAELDGVESVLSHAAGLGFLPGVEVGLAYAQRWQGGDSPASVTGLLGLPLGPLSLGLAVSRISDGGTSDSASTRLDFGFALAFGDALSLGLRLESLYSDTFPTIDAYETWSAGLTMRPVPALSIAFSVDRFDTPKLGAAVLDPVIRLSAAFRPGTDRLTLAAETWSVPIEDGSRGAGGSLRVMVVPGLVLGGYGRWSDPGVDALGLGEAERVEWGAYLGVTTGALTLDASFDGATPTGDAPSGADPSAGFALLAKYGSGQRPSLVNPSHQVVQLRIDGPIPERPAGTLFGSGPTPFGYWGAALHVMAADDAVDGILIKLGGAPGWAQCWELRRALQRFKDNDKKVVIYVPAQLDMRGMYLASIADHLLLDPAGVALLPGLAVTRTYYAELLRALGVNVQIVRLEDYKTAPEVFTETGPTRPSEITTDHILTTLLAAWRDAVQTGRKLTPEALDAAVAGTPQVLGDAVDAGLVDERVYEDALPEAVRRLVGPEAQLVARYRPALRAWKRWSGTRRIVVVPIVGNMVDGETPVNLPIPFIGGDATGDATFVEALQHAAAAPDVVGIVVRIASPGGSVLASDKMRRAIELARKKKPLVVSFGDFAASGGYYAATGAERILSTPLTLTGSIGIFNGKVDLSGLYDKIGLSTHTQKTHAHADVLSSARPWTPEEVETALEAIRRFYALFVRYVAEARGLSLSEAYAAAQGRVWMGEAALDLRLVDAHAGLHDAIEAIRVQAALGDEPVSLDYLPRPGFFVGLSRLLAAGLGQGDGPGALATAPPDPLLATVAAPLVKLLRGLYGLGQLGLMARLPYDIEVGP